MSSDYAIKVDNLSKCYQIYAKPQDRLKQALLPRLRKYCGLPHQQYFKDFWALRDVSFEVKKGETLGIIGRNGSGKSTLLQMICGTLNPTSGSIQTNGRIAALLELGSGFNPEFTGRENIFMNAAVLGLTHAETLAKYDDILAFADIGDFIHQPVKTYSSGMYVRLAFAVAINVEPDILIVDEALAVGDAKFQAKCFTKLDNIKKSGTSILFVTHSTEQIVTHCDTAIILDDGYLYKSGVPKTLVNFYYDLLFGTQEKRIEDHYDEAVTDNTGLDISTCKDLFYTHNSYNKNEYRWGNGDARIIDYALYADNKQYPVTIGNELCILLTCSIAFYKRVKEPIFGITIKNTQGITLYGTNTIEKQISSSDCDNNDVVIVKAKFKANFSVGDYFISIGIASYLNGELIPHDRRYDAIHFNVNKKQDYFGIYDLYAEISKFDKQ